MTILCGVIVGLRFQVLETDASIYYVHSEIIVEVYFDEIAYPLESFSPDLMG